MEDRHVFLNVPFDPAYEPLFLSLITALICLGLTPCSVVQLPEKGQGRMNRLHSLIGNCGTSIHDLSRVVGPARFNMPFELGLACSLQTSNPEHQIVVLERKEYRLQRTLSDYNGRDPIIHKGNNKRLLMSILNHFEVPAPPNPEAATKVLDLLVPTVEGIKTRHGQELIASPGVYKEVVAAATQLAITENLIKLN